jgi:hypothetical protein
MNPIFNFHVATIMTLRYYFAGFGAAQPKTIPLYIQSHQTPTPLCLFILAAASTEGRGLLLLTWPCFVERQCQDFGSAFLPFRRPVLEIFAEHVTCLFNGHPLWQAIRFGCID